MSGLTEKKCLPCEGGVPPLPRAECERLLAQLSPEWRLSPDGTELQREFAFKDFYRTISKEKIYVERNLGFEAEHHHRALHDVQGVEFYVVRSCIAT